MCNKCLHTLTSQSGGTSNSHRRQTTSCLSKSAHIHPQHDYTGTIREQQAWDLADDNDALGKFT